MKIRSGFRQLAICCVLISFASLAFAQTGEQKTRGGLEQDRTDNGSPPSELQTATFGAGCFWCVEAVYLKLRGVERVTSGYMGGVLPNPTYQAVLTGQTGHAEVIQIEFDPKQISFTDLLEVLFEVHDPTTLKRQGNDIGTQYRSAIFFHDTRQQQEAEEYIQKLTKEKKFSRKIVTEVTAASTFYRAEDYHQDYFSRNPQNQYCRATIPPKLRKLQKNFKEKIKD
jgi:peptide-methionine (S)-S-oxide reductase